jgi:hypothetical protein
VTIGCTNMVNQLGAVLVATTHSYSRRVSRARTQWCCF